MNGFAAEVGEVQFQAVPFAVETELQAERAILKLKLVANGGGVIGGFVSVDMQIAVSQVDLLVTAGGFIAAGRPLVARLVLQLLRLGPFEVVCENQFAMRLRWFSGIRAEYGAEQQAGENEQQATFHRQVRNGVKRYGKL